MIDQEKLTLLTQVFLAELKKRREERDVTKLEDLIQALLEQLKVNYACTEEIRQMYSIQTDKLVEIQNAIKNLKSEMQYQKDMTGEKTQEILALFNGTKGLHAMKTEMERKLCYMSDSIYSTENSLQARLDAVQKSFTSQFGLLDRWMSKYTQPRILKYILGLQILLVLLLGVGIMVMNIIIL